MGQRADWGKKNCTSMYYLHWQLWESITNIRRTLNQQRVLIKNSETCFLFFSCLPLVHLFEKKMGDAQTHNLGPRYYTHFGHVMDIIYLLYYVHYMPKVCKIRQKIMCGQHQDMSGQDDQTHLNWAVRKKRSRQYFCTCAQ
jgi:hypothetical protein